MGCDWYEERIMEYLDGIIDAREKRELEQHMDKCAHCSEFLEAMRRQYELLSDLPLLSPGQDFTQKVMTKIYSEKVGENVPIMLAIPASVLVILTAVSLLVTRNPADIIPILTGAVDWVVLVVKNVSGIFNSVLWTAGFILKIAADLQPALTFPGRILAEIWSHHPAGTVLVIMVFMAEFSMWVRLMAPRRSYR